MCNQVLNIEIMEIFSIEPTQLIKDKHRENVSWLFKLWEEKNIPLNGVCVFVFLVKFLLEIYQFFLNERVHISVWLNTIFSTKSHFFFDFAVISVCM